MKKIKACPYCGKYPVLRLQYGFWRIECRNEDCPGKVKGATNRDLMIEAWNTRLKPEKHYGEGIFGEE
jgi:ribosomal protein L37AE/L43A